MFVLHRMRQWQTIVLVVVMGLVLTQSLPVKEKKPTPEEEKKAAEAHEGDDTDDWVSDAYCAWSCFSASNTN